MSTKGKRKELLLIFSILMLCLTSMVFGAGHRAEYGLFSLENEISNRKGIG